MIVAVQVEVLINTDRYSDYEPGITDPQELAREIVLDDLVSRDMGNRNDNDGCAVVGSREMSPDDVAAWQAEAIRNQSSA